MLRAVRMKRLSLIAILAVFALPATAEAAGSVSGATHAVILASPKKAAPSSTKELPR